jgi:hypothetical protein
MVFLANIPSATHHGESSGGVRFVGPGSGANVVGHATGGVFGTVDDHHLQNITGQITWGISWEMVDLW